MTCPECGCKTRVTETVAREDHVIRRRQCLACKKFFYTEETDSEAAHEEFLELYRERNHKRSAKT